LKRIILAVARSFLKLGPLENRLRNFSNDKTESSFWVKIIPPHHTYSKGSHRSYTSPEGISFLLDISDLVDWYLYFGIKERAHEKLYSLSKAGYTYLDIGTNIGAVLLRMASLNKEGSIHGFEPDAYNFRKCTKNVELNNFTNIKLNNVGLGEDVKEAFMIVPDERNRGMNRITSGAGAGQDIGKIKIDTLDNYVSRNQIAAVDLIKIDTEGYEMNVLKGATQIIDSFKPILFIELDDNNLKEQGSSAVELMQFLTERKYAVTNAEDGSTFPATYDYSNCHVDIVAK
jgi:FkbM family methyltransferase